MSDITFQVTYPYIMAKVRIQARSSDADASESERLPGSQNKEKQAGALGLLLRVLRKEGFVGWYQVRITVLSLLFHADSDNI